MKKLLLIIAALAAFASASAENIKLTLSQILPLANALASLDAGQTKIIKASDREGSAGDKVVQLPYEFSGSTRWAIARNLGALKREVEAFEKTRSDLIKQISGGGTEISSKDTNKMARFLAEITPVSEKPITVDLQRIKPDDLKLDANPIPSATLVSLEPILQN